MFHALLLLLMGSWASAGAQSSANSSTVAGLPTAPCSAVPEPTYRIINGIEAKPDEFPWIVSLRVDGMHYCGASLIAPQVVLTAAHCVAPQNNSNLPDTRFPNVRFRFHARLKFVS